MTYDSRHQPPKKPVIQVENELRDPYQVLQIPRTASLEEIKKAYFAQVRLFPPEKRPEEFKQIRKAYDSLRTPEAKAATDLFLVHPPVDYTPPKRALSFNLKFQPTDWNLVVRTFSELVRDDFSDDFSEIQV